MTAPVFLLPAPALDEVRAGDEVVLDGPEGRHAVSVVRMTEGEPIILVDGAGRQAMGTVAGTRGRDSATVLVCTVIVDPDPQPRITVVQALPKGERGELAVELLTEIGVDVIVPWAAQNCVAQWKGDRAERGHRRWLDASRAAAKQSRRSRFPEVAPLHRTEQVVALVEWADVGIILHETATMPIGALPTPTRGEVVLVVGPEGGLTDAELAAFEAAGAQIALLGPTVLRTSSAGIAAVSALLAGSSRWGARADSNGMGG